MSAGIEQSTLGAPVHRRLAGMPSLLRMSLLPTPCRVDPTSSRAGCSGPGRDRADVVAQFPG